MTDGEGTHSRGYGSERNSPLDNSWRAFRVRFDAANDLLTHGRAEEAVAIYEDLLQQDPRSAALFCKLAQAKQDLGLKDAAFALFSRAVEIQADFVWGHVGLARLHDVDEDHDKALDALEMALKCGPAPDIVLQLMAEQLMKAAAQRLRRDQPDAAEALFLQSLEIKDAPAELEEQFRADLAGLYQSQGRFEEAAEVLASGAPEGDPQVEEVQDRAANSGPLRVLVADGRDDQFGRSLLLISALHVAAPYLGGVCVRFFNVQSDAVRAAIEALAWDTGIQVETAVSGRAAPADPVAVAAGDLVGASGLVGVAFRTARHLRAHMEEAARLGIARLVPVQFPRGDASSAEVALEPLAHDPNLLAARIVAMVKG